VSDYFGQTLHWARLLTRGTARYHDANTAAHTLGRPYTPDTNLPLGAILFWPNDRHGDAGVYVGDGYALRYRNGPHLHPIRRDPPESWTPNLNEDTRST
jgi:hypothetical protein